MVGKRRVINAECLGLQRESRTILSDYGPTQSSYCNHAFRKCWRVDSHHRSEVYETSEDGFSSTPVGGDEQGLGNLAKPCRHFVSPLPQASRLHPVKADWLRLVANSTQSNGRDLFEGPQGYVSRFARHKRDTPIREKTRIVCGGVVLFAAGLVLWHVARRRLRLLAAFPDAVRGGFHHLLTTLSGIATTALHIRFVRTNSPPSTARLAGLAAAQASHTPTTEAGPQAGAIGATTGGDGIVGAGETALGGQAPGWQATADHAAGAA